MLQQIDLLEKEIGIPLLVRNHRGVKPTAAGEVFYAGAIKLLKQTNKLIQSVRSCAEKQQTALSIGIFSTKLMNQLCVGFSSKYPVLPLKYMMISDHTWLSSLDLVSNGTLDIFEHAEVPEVHQNGLLFTPLFQCRCACVFSSTHPFANQQSISTADLSNQKICVFGESCVPGLRTLLQENASGSLLIDNQTGLPFAFDHCRNGGICIIADIFQEEYFPLHIIPLDCDLRYTFGLVCKENPSPAVRQFIEYAKQEDQNKNL